MDTKKKGIDDDDGDEEIQCRICADYFGNDDERIYIFHGETRENCIQGRIQKYLHIKISTEDKLSKMVCGTCVKKLDGIHQFAMMAHKAQEKLRAQAYDNCHGDIDDDFSKENDMKNSKGLLRTILTSKEGKDVPDIQNSPDTSVLSPQLSDADDTPSITEQMEVKVDPMIFLQCGLERSLSPGIDDDDDDDDDYLDYDERPLHIKDSSQDGETNQKSNGISRPLEEPSSDSNQKTYDCTICSRSFASQLSLQNHLWSHLPRGDPSSEDEKSHQDGISRGGNPDSDNSSGFGGANANFVCPICNKKISTKGNLKVHLETHRPKGKYGCDICGRIFKTQSNLYRHKEYHGGIQFPCSVCGRVYPTNSTLRAHSITHSDLRPHACPLCDKTFKRNQDLKFHINQHTGARPYQCPYCPKAFASSGNCFSHRKRMHPREVHRDRQRAADLMR